MEREVGIQSLGNTWARLEVTYRGVPCLYWPNIKAPYTTLEAGNPASGHVNRPFFLRVISDYLASADKAKNWLAQLDAEVLDLAARQKEFHDAFKALEGKQSLGI